ncbi:M48 family metallopeptidase [Cyanobium sp. HWJ4-Hawea]|uniref:M48 family metallopeptidase n=1 Tax=Cyanobium sp. HWJ4-Hawea TaxID=2823713 RepID=UPI0020CF3968|nr:SprT family zinc-dependent metalloprotease [Cyanobium sp. HWJ4-Hawea]MCP9808843.1 M48 family metallopeptidase [Cyanobium sp. HWJ4-Hawea]
MPRVYHSHQIVIGGLSVEVTLKPIKNLHLSVDPPDGTVRISAPEQMSANLIRSYAIGKLSWIRKQQKKLEGQQRESPRMVVERESHHLWGRRLLLSIQEVEAPPRVEVNTKQMLLFVRSGTTEEKRRSLLAAWYRDQIRKEAASLIRKWEQQLDVRVNRLFVQAMTRQWGGCNPASGNIRLNTHLAQKPKGCLDYVVLHELAHLRVPSHGEGFIALLDSHMPEWKDRRHLLNNLPLISGKYQ